MAKKEIIKFIKKGMTSRFSENNKFEPCTVLQLPRSQLIKDENNRKLIFFNCCKTPTKPIRGEMKKYNIQEKKGAFYETTWKDVLETISVGLFKSLKYVATQGTTIGHGFQGVIKRHGMAGGRASHGNSLAHRTPGSVGLGNQDPGKVQKGKKMPGHMGNKTCTIENLKILDMDLENDLLVVKGSVPGRIGSVINVSPGRKK